VVGTDTYALLSGGTWISHDVDVRLGEQRVLAHEVIGGRHPPVDGGCTPSTGEPVA